MPLNTLRLNHAPSSHPNERIIFIKPLPRPPELQHEQDTADLMLRAIAAQCLPIMKHNCLSVTTLEEYEPNPEFVGRNFNNGEVIQLVLQAGRSSTDSPQRPNDSGVVEGRWLPINMVQMVMMHELAHNLQMNHSRAFWQVRNQFAAEMKQLWRRGYTGDGLWGSGRTVRELGAATHGHVVTSAELKDLPVCGGTFRSRGRRKRKRKGTGTTGELTWQEKRDRRIEKRFGKNGHALGEDEDKRLGLEITGKGPIGVKPRVAQSKRGRELRAAAALARVDTNKQDAEHVGELLQEPGDGERSDEYGDGDTEDDQDDARDSHGVKIVDQNGRGMMKVCEQDDADNVQVKQEMDELTGLDHWLQEHNHRAERPDGTHTEPVHTRAEPDRILARKSPIKAETLPPPGTRTTRHGMSEISTPTPATRRDREHAAPTSANPASLSSPSALAACPICTTLFQAGDVTCRTCSHVRDSSQDPRSWTCRSEVCRMSDSGYVNSGDVGRCGVCGQRQGET